MVVLQKPTKPFTAWNVAISLPIFLPGFDELVAQALVISFAMIVEQELADSISQRSLTEKDESMEALLLQAQMEPLDLRIQIRTSRWQSHWLHISISQDRSEPIAEIRIPVH